MSLIMVITSAWWLEISSHKCSFSLVNRLARADAVSASLTADSILPGTSDVA